MDINAYKCYECSQQLAELDQAIEHLKLHDIKNSLESEIRCIKVQVSCNLVCTSRFQTFQALKRHISRNNCKIRSSNAESDDSNHKEMGLLNKFGELSFKENFSSSNEEENNHEKSKCCENFASFMGTFIDKLTSFNLHHDVLDQIFVLSKKLVLQSTELNKQLIRDNPKQEVEFVLDSTNDFVASHIDSVKTRYKRKSHIAESQYFVEPKQIHVDSSFANGTVYFASVLETLYRMFANEHFRREYFDYNENHRCKEGVYERYCCGQNFKENRFFQSNKHSIQIQIFFDDFQVTNPLGTKKVKLTAIYFIVRNFPPKFVSQLKNMYLVLLCNSQVVSNNGCNAILEHLVREIKILESEGIKIDDKLFLKGTLVQVSFDNLGGNIIFGFVPNFNCTYFCRICYCDHGTCRKITREIAEKIRTKNHYNTQIAKVKSILESGKEIDFTKTFGIKNYCVLNELKYYHTISNRSQDIMHDMYEGAMPLTLNSLFSHFLKNNIITKNDIVQRILAFNFGILERSNKPSPVLLGKKNLNQNASQMRCLMLHFPFIFFDLLKLQDTEKRIVVHNAWRVVEYLLKINQIISSSILTEENLTNLDNFIETYLECYKATFGSTFTPKLHFITHYPNTVRAMGPITILQIMRGDAKHQTFVRFAKNTKCFVNICKTLSDKHQEMMEFELRTNTFCDKIKTSSASRPASKSGKLITEFESHMPMFSEYFSNIEEVIVRDFLIANSFRFQKGLFVVLIDQMYQIDAIMQHQKQITFLCTLFAAVKFHKFANCFQVKKSRKQLLIRFSDLTCKRSFEGKFLNGEIQIIADNLDIQSIYEKLYEHT